MPPETWEEQGSGMLPEIAMLVHMTKTGAAERAPVEQERDIALLRRALEHWQPSLSPRTARFDEAVRCLLVAVLEEKGWYG